MSCNSPFSFILEFEIHVSDNLWDGFGDFEQTNVLSEASASTLAKLDSHMSVCY
jgi:hypothetical protein